MRLHAEEIVQQRCHVTAPLGECELGSVYRAQDSRLDVPVAVRSSFRRTMGSPGFRRIQQGHLPRVAYHNAGKVWYAPPKRPFLASFRASHPTTRRNPKDPSHEVIPAVPDSGIKGWEDLTRRHTLDE
jgi:hypothetical protein